MLAEREACIARFFATDGITAIGAGFLVSETTVLTCAHVISAVLDIDENASTAPAEKVLLDFPLVAPNRRLAAHVCLWQPPQPNGGGDIAVLLLDDHPPAGIKVTRLVHTSEDLWGHDFRAFGFPGGHPDGVWASGKLRGRRATGWVQIEDIKESGYRVQPGFSGGAIWDEQLDGVVGMVVAADTDPTIKAAYMIPTHVLIKAWPQLEQEAIPACPYRGLSAFREKDAPYFFGRKALTQRLVDAIARKPLVAVIGSSGSGKSSVVFAGLIPRLRDRGNWLFAPFRPGNRPFYSLAAALISLLEPQMSETDRLVEVNKQARYLQQGNLSLQDILDTILQKSPGMRLLLIADQFEELYTLCEEPEVRQRFLDELLAALQTASNQNTLSLNLLLTLRADFVGQAISYRPFADALQYADLKLGPMNAQELHDVITEPARKLHVKIEDGLTERILKEVSQEPGHLPLLEFALTLLWAKQKDGKLTHAAYTEISGVEKALADHAEEVYNAFTEQQQLQARRIFIQLVRPGEGTEDTRRLATRADIGEHNRGLVMRLSSARLIVTGRDTTTGEETVEVIHEALIQGWQRLRDWIEESREFRTWQERLRAALRQWESKGRDNGALLRGALLVEASEWLKQRPEAISSQEQMFVEASQQQEMQEAQYLRGLLEESEQGRQEAERQRLIAEQQSQEAERQQRIAEQQRQEAERQRQVALARGLAAQAVLYSQYDQPPRLIERSILLAIESLRRYPSPEADQALRERGALLRRRVGTLGHEGGVRAVAFSPDGKVLATASDDETTGVWEVSSGKRVATLGYEGMVSAVAFSPDGKLLAAASLDKTVGIWEAETGKQIARLTYAKTVTAVAFSPDGGLVVTASGGTIGIWEAETGKQVARPTTHGGAGTAVALSPDRRLVAKADEDEITGEGYAWIWEAETGKQVVMLSHGGGRVRAIAFSPNGRLVATAGEDKFGSRGYARICEAETGRQLARLTYEERVYGVAFSPDGRWVATASEDKTAGIWEAETGKRVAMLNHDAGVRAVAFSPDGRWVATASEDKTAGIWEAETGKQVVRLDHYEVRDAVELGPERLVTGVAFSPDGRLVATASEYGTARIWKAETGKRVAMLVAARGVAHGGGVVTGVAFSPDGKVLATASGDGPARIWEAGTGRQLARLTYGERVYRVAFSPDGQLVATASLEDKTAGIWKAETGKRVARLTHKDIVCGVVFSPDGRWVATASKDKTAGIWKAETGKRVARLTHEYTVYGVAFSPDGKLLATASGDGTAGVWEVSSGKRVATLGHEGVVRAVAFSPGGRYLATASSDKTAGVWDVTSGRQIVQLVHEKSVSAMAFSPDGRYLATASGTIVQFWLWKPEDLIADVRSRLNRNLTPDEWKQYIGDEPYRKTFPELP